MIKADKDNNNSTKKTFFNQHNTQMYTLLALFTTLECTRRQLDLIIFRAIKATREYGQTGST